jgi:hypothetical protein
LLVAVLAAVSSLNVAKETEAQTPPREPHHFLRTHVGFTDEEFRILDRGDVVSKVLGTSEQHEVAVLGIVWIDAPMNDFVRWQKDIERFERGDAVEAIRKIGTPPRLEDFDGLSAPAEDLEDLRECRVGDCEVKVTEEALARIQSEVDWSAPDAHEQANRLIRQMFFEFTKEYIRDGDGALGAYRDKKRPTFLEKEFDGLLEQSPYLVEYLPELHAYLDDYPRSELEGAESFLYWSKVRFGLKPMVRLNHVVIYPFGRVGKDVAIASKMLYASHYFFSALELKFLVQDTAHLDREGYYLISLNRSRSDGLTGLFGGIVRSKGESEAQKGLEAALASARDVLERSAGEASPPPGR